VGDGKTLFASHHDGALLHGEALPELVAQGLKLESRIDQVIVGMGPGPFTGLRAGISFAQSFALGRGIPWQGVCSLDAIATQISESDFIVAIDARRKEVFFARYTGHARIGEPNVCQPSQLLAYGISIFGEEKNQFPDPKAFVAIAKTGATYSQPIYVRRPDAYPAPVGVKFRAMNQLDLVPAFSIEKSAYGKEAWTMAQLKE
jgi:tRNA threonylcarbamoyl adenosine modification protein YeaZ